MNQGQDTIINPPVAKKIEKQLEKHGHTRIDNYFWMNERDSEPVLEYLNAENDYVEAKMKHTEKLQDELYEEMVGRIKKDDSSVPYLSNGYYYYSRYEEGMEYPLYCRKKGNLEAEEEVMLNVNEMAEGYAYYAVTGLRVSPDNKILAYGVDTVSRRQYTIHFKNLETGEIYADAIPNTGGSVAWANDNKTIFYAQKDDALRSAFIYRHTLGTAVDTDVLLHEEADETFSTYVWRSNTGNYIFMGSFATMTSEAKFISASDPYGDWTVVSPRKRGVEYSVADFGDHLYIKTNLDAQNFKVVRAPINNPGMENWEEFIAHREDVLVEGIDIFSGHLVVSERFNGLPRILIKNWAGEEHYLDFGEETYSAYTSANYEYDTPWLRFAYTSLTTPNSVIDYNMNTKEKLVKKEQEVVGGYDKELYYAERIWATADDGTQVPISLVYRKDLKKETGNPTLLYGYGSYGYSLDAYFSSVRLSLLDRGFVYAIAHIRGGEEMGRHWYEDGKKLKKMNTFTDFISCGEHLVAEKYALEDQLFAMGGSAGGLLMGAVINIKPEIWKGVIAAVPFVDVVTTMLDESIPLTTGEYDEWGNPNDEEFYHYMLSYSPYDNIEAKDYPNLLITTGYHDSQVQYWEPAKWTAKLRELKTDDNLLLFHCNMDAGHGGASGRFQRYKEIALEYAFILDLAK